MKKSLILTLVMSLSLFFVSQMHAQSYEKAIGARIGSPLALSYKMFLNESLTAVEIYGNMRRNGNVFSGYGWTRFGAGAAVQIHNELDDVLDNLLWYYGGGGSVYFWRYDDNSFFDEYDNLSFGIQLFIGFDYKIEDTPINISIDWSPTLFINGYTDGFGYRSGSVAARYILE